MPPKMNPTPAAASAELQAIEARQLQADISALKEMQSLTEFSYQNSAIQRAIAALSQSSAAQKAVEACGKLFASMPTITLRPMGDGAFDICFGYEPEDADPRKMLSAAEEIVGILVASQLPRPT